jgi:hypothetical protein
MVSLTTVFAGLTVLISYIAYKNHALKSSSELQEAIQNRLKPKYTINEPLNSEILPHTKWPSEEYHFEVWHVEVHETRWMRWRKWLPFGKFRGVTIVQYKVEGHQPPKQEQLQNHINARQPYIRSIDTDTYNPQKIKVIYESVKPENISLFVKQFKYLLRDTTFRQLNPDADLQYEMIKGKDGDLYARIFDANVSDSIGNEEFQDEFS